MSTFLLAILLMASEALYLLLLRLDAINGVRPVAIFLGILGACFALCFAAYFVLRNGSAGFLAWTLIVGGAILFRITLLPAGLPPGLSLSEKLTAMEADWRGDAVSYERFQLFDDDIWRYLWDGSVAAAGRNPYLFPPDDPSLDDISNSGTNGRPDWETIRDNVNYPGIRTIYPPLAQTVFRVAHGLAPGSVLAMKVIAVSFDLLAYGFVMLTLAAWKQPLARSVLYGWNPLVIKVFAGSGHIDAILVAALVGTCYFLARKRPTAAAVSLGLAIAAKLAPLVLLPFFARRAGVWRTLLVCIIPIACYLPYASAGLDLFSGLRTFSASWQFNSGPFRVLALLMPDGLARMTCAALIAMSILLLFCRDDSDPDTLARVAVIALGAVLIFSPVVTPWYVTWLLPLGVLAWNRVSIFFSVAVCMAFLVMVRGVEWPWALVLEYGSLGLTTWWEIAKGTFVQPSRHSRNEMIRRVCIMLCATALITAAARAQGSGNAPLAELGSADTASDGDSPFTVTRTLAGKILWVKKDVRETLIVVEDSQGRRGVFTVNQKTRFRADRKTELGSKKRISADDLQVGQIVRVSFVPDNGRVVRMRFTAKA